MALPVCLFVQEKIPLLLSRYEFFYYQEDRCVEYFIRKKGTKEPISRALVFSYNESARQIHVSKFYPELCKQTQCKYLSAACFYLLATHFAHVYRLPDNCPIGLDTLPETHRRFFGKLKDFGFHVEWVELCQTAHLRGTCPHLDIDPSVIERKDPGRPNSAFLI